MARTQWIAALVFLGALTLYLRTLAPSVAFLFDDSLEFQLVGFKLAIAHPTGYPLYTLLLKLSSWLPFGDVAWRANLLSAICAALAVTLVCLSVLRLTDSVLASLGAAAALAVSPVFWSQAVVAEVYALNALFVAAIVWRLVISNWELGIGSWNGRLLAFLLGLSLTHHRTIVLLVPALAIYIWLNRNSQIRILSGIGTTPPKDAIRKSLISNYQLLITFLLPLLLYLYIPLRGAVGSLDGTYQNTLDGFARWVTASGYATTFFSDNPLAKSRDAKFFFDLFLNQFGWLGLALGVIGFGALIKVTSDEWRVARRSSLGIWSLGSFGYAQGRFGIFLLIAFLTALAFVLVYRVPDVEVFAIPAFLILAVALGDGLHVILRWASRVRSPALRFASFAFLGITLGANFAPIFQSALAQNDLSRKTDVRDYGRDSMAQPFPANSTLVGILGEMTLVRYFQATEGLQLALVTIAADDDAKRLATLDDELRAGHAVFTTRPLKGLPEKYSLSAVGPLVRVWSAPQASDLPADAPRVDSIKYRKEAISQPTARVVRAQVAWQPTASITADLKISARLMDGDNLIAQKDGWPVHNAYHTPFWRVGELIQDAHDVRLPDDAPAKSYRVLLIVYRADSGAEVGRVDFGDVEVRR